MTLKGVGQEKRDSRWHKRHELRLLKDKARRIARRGTRKGVNIHKGRLPFFQEKAMKFADEKKEQRAKMPLKIRLWLWFIRLRIVKAIREVAYRYQEKKYKG